jgi:hypothetical protein
LKVLTINSYLHAREIYKWNYFFKNLKKTCKSGLRCGGDGQPFGWLKASYFIRKKKMIDDHKIRIMKLENLRNMTAKIPLKTFGVLRSLADRQLNTEFPERNSRRARRWYNRHQRFKNNAVAHIRVSN